MVFFLSAFIAFTFQNQIAPFPLHSGPHPKHYPHNLQHPPFLLIAMNRENRPLVTKEPIEFEK